LQSSRAALRTEKCAGEDEEEADPMPMSKRETEAFLKQPNVAVMAVTAPDGSPHSVPVWYEWKGGAAILFMFRESFKFKCLQHDPRITLVVDTKKRPYKCVILKGRAEIEFKRADAWVRRISISYYGKREGLKYADTLKGTEFAFATLRPERVISWDYAKDSDS
jgi:PPOX class probable F420-dependent enzyme